MTADPHPVSPFPAPALPLTPVAAAAEDALLLLRSGRAAMAQRVLEGLPAQIRDGLGAAYARGHDVAAAQLGGMRTAKDVLEREIARDQVELRRLEDAIATRRRTLARLERPDTGERPMRNHEQLTAALAEGRITVERVATLLRVREADVAPIAAGRIGLSTPAWRKVMAELETAERRAREAGR